jgi:hypothetical protein
MAIGELVEGERGILTERDREYLIGEIDMESEYKNPEKQEYVIRGRIRDRVEQAIKDFIFIDRYLSDEDWDKILEEWDDLDTEIRKEASRNEEAPNPFEHEYPDIAKGLESGLSVILNSMAEVFDRDHAFAFVEHNIKDIIQTQTAIEKDEFYYGNVSFRPDGSEDVTIELDSAFEYLDNAFEKKAEAQTDLKRAVVEATTEYIEKLPDMPDSDYVALIDQFYLTGRFASRQEYEEIRRAMMEIVWVEKKQAIDEAIEDWHLDPEYWD